jgi:hypothetical protein
LQGNNKGTGYDYPDLPGLGNNNENLGLPERISTGKQFRFRNLFHGKKNRVIVILFVRITWSCVSIIVVICIFPPGALIWLIYLFLFLFLLPGKNKISKTKETAEWTCSVCKIDVHLYASIVCDGCL